MDLNITRRGFILGGGCLIGGLGGCSLPGSNRMDYRIAFPQPRPVLKDPLSADAVPPSYTARLFTSPEDEAIVCRDELIGGVDGYLDETDYDAGQFWSVVEIVLPEDWDCETRELRRNGTTIEHILELFRGHRRAMATERYTLFASYETDPSSLPDTVGVTRVIEEPPGDEKQCRSVTPDDGQTDQNRQRGNEGQC